MKKLLTALVFCMLFAFAASIAEVIQLPGSIQTIESEAFSGIGPAHGIYLPPDAAEIAEDAFSDPSLTVYGHSGTYAEQFAKATGRAFIPVDITDIHLECPEWAAPDAPISVSARATSTMWPLKYRFIAEKNSMVFYKSEWLALPSHSFALPEGGQYTITVEVSHEWAKSAARFENALTVEDRILINPESLKIGIGETLDLLLPGETREVILSTENPGLLSINGRMITGLARGNAKVKAVSHQPKGDIVTEAQIEIYTPVEQIVLTDAPQTLFVGQSARLNASVLPENADYPLITYESENEAIVSVDASGVITANSRGETAILLRSDKCTYRHVIKATKPVESIQISSPSGSAVYTKGTIALQAVCLPEDADNRLALFSSASPEIARVSINGVVTGVSPGSALITATAADQGGATGAFLVTVSQGVDSLTLSVSQTRLYPGDEIQAVCRITPENAGGKTLVWSSSNASIASVSQSGLITAHATGVVTIACEAENGVRSAVTITIASDRAPERLTLSKTELDLAMDETTRLIATASPEGEYALVWYSANDSIATVDQNGSVRGISPGRTTVGVRSAIDSTVSASATVIVTNPSRTLIMPIRRTEISGIGSNVTRIANVRTSAERELQSLVIRGSISESEKTERMRVINEAFKMYSFPWMTRSLQPYWNSANSENGAKDFKPGTVYYGLPYTQNYSQRFYNTTRLLNENRFYKSDGAYYILNQNNLSNGNYCGNDCSSMVTACYFGTGSGYHSWNTRTLYSTTKFNTLSASAELRPGDILVRNGRHVVMFLYYANEAKTQIVVIEQGGNEAGINTVSTSVYSLSSYLNNSYIPRRYAGWE